MASLIRLNMTERQVQDHEAVALGAELRRRRRERGLSQRAFTRMLGLSAHSNIADYEAGRRIPPRDILRQCETLLGVTDGQLCAMHARALAERAAPTSPTGPPETTAPTTDRRVQRRVGGVTLVVAVGLMIALSSGPEHSGASPTTTDKPAAEPSTWDGNDPKAAGCVADAVTVDSKPVLTTAAAVMGAVRLPAGTQIGRVNLRYSPRCGAAWPKFEPVLAPITDQAITVTVTALRPVDGMRAIFEYPRLEQTYGDILLTAPGCVQASASVGFAGSAVASGTTDCVRPAR